MKTIVTSLLAAGFALSAFSASAATARYASSIFVDEGDYSKAATFPADPQRFDPNNALGEPTFTAGEPDDWFSLGIGGAAAFAFGNPPRAFKDSTLIIEATFKCDQGPGTCPDSQEETADVYVLSSAAAPFVTDGVTSFGTTNYDFSGFLGDTANANAGDNVFFVGSLPNATAQFPGATFLLGAALAELGDLAYVLIVDTSGTLPKISTIDGFDVVSVQVQAIPLPLSASLMLAGFAGLAWVGRSRKAA